jgi:hypothetical protein
MLLHGDTIDDQPGTTMPAHTLGVGRSGFPSLLDTSLFSTLTTSFVLGFVSLVSIFIIFTLFELWRFIGSNHVPAAIVGKYLLFLLPLVAVELFPATMLITVLITYALLARRNEAIAWWASGQSVYRLMMPGLLFAIAAGAGTWLVQEHLMPPANVRQEALRARIRGGEARAITGTGRQWLASVESGRLYSYEFDEQSGVLSDPAIYELDDQAVHLRKVTTGKLGVWKGTNQLFIKDAETVSLKDMVVERQHEPEAVVSRVDPPQVFRPTVDKPSAWRGCLGAVVVVAAEICQSIQRDCNGVHRHAIGAGVWQTRGHCSVVCGGGGERGLLGNWRWISATGKSWIAAAGSGSMGAACDLRGCRNLFSFQSAHVVNVACCVAMRSVPPRGSGWLAAKARMQGFQHSSQPTSHGLPLTRPLIAA